MAVSENDLVVGPLTPAAGVTTISLDFYFEQASWLEVYKSGSETPLVLNTDYTVTGAGTGFGVVTLAVAANGTDAYSVYLIVPLQRSSDMQLRGEFKSDPFNIEMDRIWQAIQGINTRVAQSLRISRTSLVVGPLATGSAAARAGRALVFGASGSDLGIGPTTAEIASAGTSATEAATQAGNAATQAGIATVQAGLASDFYDDIVNVDLSSELYSRTGAEAAIIPAGVEIIYVTFNAVVLKYQRGGDALRSADGAWWRPAEDANFLHWGVAPNNRGAAASNADGINKADAYCAGRGQVLHMPAGTIFFSKRLNKSAAWEGAGCGYWPMQPAKRRPAVEQLVPAAPTQLVAVGTFARDLYLPGVSDMAASGATRDNPSARGAGFNDAVYKWPSFMNANGTLRAVSVAIFDKSVGKKSSGYRVVPDFGGASGLDGYCDNNNNTRSTADVDIGTVWQDCDGTVFEHIAVVGHWRMAGRMIPGVPFWDGTGTIANMEVNPYHITSNDCHFQGYVACLELGSDSYKVVSVSGSTIRVPWADTLCLRDSTVWNEMRYNKTESWDGFFIPENILSVVRDGANPALAVVTFDANITARFDAGDTLVMRAYGGGNSHTIDSRLRMQGFTFSNGAMAHDAGRVSGAFDAPSIAWVSSGHRSTERVMHDPMIQHTEEVAFMVHDVAKVFLTNFEFEKISDVSGGNRALRFIASPGSGNSTYHPYPCGGTFQFSITANTAVRFPGLDFGPALPVARGNTFNGAGDVGFFEPELLVFPDYTGSTAYEGAYLRPFAGEKAGIKKAGHPFSSNAFVYNSVTDKLESSAKQLATENIEIDRSGSGQSSMFTITNDATNQSAILFKAGGLSFDMRLDPVGAEMRYLWDGNAIGKYEGGSFETGWHFIEGTYLEDDMTVRGDAQIDGDLTVTGDATMTKGVVTSGTITVAKNAVGTIVPPHKGGKLTVICMGAGAGSPYPQGQYSGELYYDTGNSVSGSKWSGGNDLDAVSVNLTGTTGAAGKVTVSARPNAIQIENQGTANDPMLFRYTFH